MTKAERLPQLIGSNELVIGHNPKAPNPYVCWYCKNGKEYFWGYYCNELSSAREKLNERYKTECIVIIFSSIFLIINSPAILWYIYMVLGIVCLLLAFNAKSFQKFVLKKAELLLDKSFRTGIVEYHFDAEGIETISQMGYSKNYWTAFKEYGTMGQYIYVKRKDNKMVLIDKNDLSTGELEELTQLLLNNVKM